MMEVSLILPMYNEERLIEKTIKTSIDYLKKKGYDYEIIVVDDGSRDNTVEKAKKFKDIKIIRLDKNYGKGYAIRQGVMKAKKDNIAYMDADLPYPIENIDKLLDFKDAHITIGSRASEGSKVKSHPNLSRKLLGKCFNVLMRLTTGLRFVDTQSGFKAFKKDAAKKIFSNITVNRWGFDVEVLFLAQKYGFKVDQVPIYLLEEHSFRKSRLNTFKDPAIMFKDLVKIRFNDIIGKY
jgi:dolichyl-phosphate beta-glucosyltransferase